MRLLLAAIVSFGLCATGASSGWSMVKLPTVCTVVDVPAKATFVVEKGYRPNPKHLKATWKSVPLGDAYEKLTVVARPGGHYQIDPVGPVCMRPRFRVTKAQASQEPFCPAATWSGSEIHLSWNQESSRSWTQVEWAYSEKHLARGWHATDMTTSATHVLSTLGVPVVLRITRHRLDGSTVTWHGWADPAQNRLRGSRFPTLARQALETPAPERPVPANPHFNIGRDSASQWIAIDSSDSVVATTSSPSRTRMATVVRVPVNAGSSVRFLKRPVAPTWKLEPALRATPPKQRTKDPVPRVVLPPRAYSDYVGVLHLRIEEQPRVLWGEFELDWALERKDLGSHPVRSDNEHDFAFYSDKSVFANGRPAFPRDFQRLYIRVTPIWANDVRGPSFEGRIDRRPNTDAVTLTTLK